MSGSERINKWENNEQVLALYESWKKTCLKILREMIFTSAWADYSTLKEISSESTERMDIRHILLKKIADYQNSQGTVYFGMVYSGILSDYSQRFYSKADD